jgi:hypothetical protein
VKIEAQNRQIRRELGRLAEQQLLTSEQRAAISERYPVTRWNVIALIRWYSILGAVSAAVGLLILARHLAAQQTLIEVALTVGTVLPLWLGAFLAGARNLPRVGAALQLLGAAALQGLTFALANHYAPDSTNWPALIGIDWVLLTGLAYALKNRLILIYGAVNFFIWFGGQTGYVSGWGVYWLGMTYPVRFLAAGTFALGVAYAHFRYLSGVYQSFSRVYAHFGLLVVNLAFWFLSLFGYFEEQAFSWEGREGQRLAFSFLWAMLAAGSIFAANPVGLRMLRAYGLTFLIINLYTFYFQFIVPNTVYLGFLHLLIVGGSMLALGISLERRWREQRTEGSS